MTGDRFEPFREERPAAPSGGSSAPGVARKRGQVAKHPNQLSWSGRLSARCLHSLLRILGASVRLQLEDRAHLPRMAGKRPQPVILCAWHNRLALAMTIYGRLVQGPEPARRLAAMVSASRDGALLAGVLERSGVQPIRGSTSRRGAQALLEMTGWAERGFDLAITPDGPRGPCYTVQDGVISLAQVTGLPIVPVSYSATAKVRLNSWDRFLVPLPLARCRVVLDSPIRVPRTASASDRATARQALEERLRSITED